MIAFIPAAVIAKKNCVSKGLPIPVAMRSEDFCIKAAPSYFAATGIIYFTASYNNRMDLITLFRGIKNPSALLEKLKDGGCIITILMIISFILFYVFWFAASKNSLKKGTDRK